MEANSTSTEFSFHLNLKVFKYSLLHTRPQQIWCVENTGVLKLVAMIMMVFDYLKYKNTSVEGTCKLTMFRETCDKLNRFFFFNGMKLYFLKNHAAFGGILTNLARSVCELWNCNKAESFVEDYFNAENFTLIFQKYRLLNGGEPEIIESMHSPNN